MDAQDFINAGSFELSDSIIFTPMSAEEAQTVIDANVQFGEFVTSESLEALTETSAVSDESSGPRFPSYQVVNEAARTVAGNLPQTAAVASTVNNALGIQQPSLEFLDQTAKLVEGQFDLTAETKQQIEDAQKLWATGTLGMANTFEKANGGFKFSTSGVWDVGANGISLNSDGSLVWNSPMVSSISTTTLQQSKAHFVTTDLKKTDTKNKYEHIEKSNTSVKGDSVDVTINTSTEVANNKDVKAVARHRISTAQSQIDASDIIDHNSEKDARVTARRGVSVQSTIVNITGSEGSKVPTASSITEDGGITGETVVNPDGTSDLVVSDAAGNLTTFRNVDESAQALAKPKWEFFPSALEGRQPGVETPAKDRAVKAGVNINTTGAVTQIAKSTVVSNDDSEVHLTGGNFGQYVQGGIIQNAASVAVAGTSSVQFTSDKGAIVATAGNSSFSLAGGITFVGARKITFTPIPSLTQAKPIKLRKIPKLPDLPKGITYDDLEKCIPEKFKPNVSTDEPAADIPETGNAPTAEDAGQREKQHPVPTGKDPGAIAEANTGQGDDGSAIQTSEEADIKDNKLGSNSPISEDSSPTNPSNVSLPDKLLGAAAVVEGGVDIFPLDADEDEEIIEKQPKELDAPDLDNSAEQPVATAGSDPLSEEALAIVEKQKEIWGDAVQAVLTPTNLDAIMEELSILPAIRAQLRESFDQITLYLRRLLPSGLPKEQEQLNENFINQPGGVREVLEELLRQTRAEMGQSGGGLIQFATSTYRKVQDGVNVVNSTIDDIADSKVGRITKTAQEYAKYIPGQAGDLVGDVAGGIQAILNSDIQAGIKFLTDNSSSLNSIYSTLKTVLQNREFGTQVIDLLGSDRLKAALRDQILLKTNIGQRLTPDPDNLGEFIETDFVEEEVQSAVSVFTTAMLAIRNDDEYEESGFTSAAVARVIQEIYSSPVLSGLSNQLIQDILDDGTVRRIWGDVLNSNVEDFLTGSAFENFLPYIVGQQNAALFSQLKGIYFRAKDIYSDVLQTYDDTREAIDDTLDTGRQLYTSLKAIPGMLALMNQYRMPVLNQVQTLLSCLDLLAQFKKLWNDVKDLIDTVSDFADPLKDTINTLEDLFDLLGIDRDGDADAGNQEDPTQDLLGLITAGDVTGTITPIPSLPPDTDPNLILPQVASDPPLADQVDPSARVANILTTDSCGNVIFSASRNTNHDDDPSKWSDKVTDDEVIKIIETLPRLTQILNSVKDMPSAEEKKDFGGLLNEDQIDDIKRTTINVDLDNCYVAPQLNLVEALVDVQEIKNGMMLFKMANLDLLKFNGKNILPNNNTLIQIYVEEFANNKTGQTLKVHRRKEFFTPYVHNFKIVEFKANRNIGIAQYIPQQPRIYLRDVSGTAFSYGTADIGNKLSPIILDSYIVL